MAKRQKNKDDSAHGQHLTAGGAVIQSKVVTGEDTKLSAHEQGQRARGEVDDKGKPTGKEPERPPGGVKVVKVDRTLYQGKISAEAIAGATGEEVSAVFVQEEPTTEDGLFYHFQQYHPSAIRDTFKIDPTNTLDPTKRTYLERP